jgi:tetratricopeptide (TPR) repeat protein
MKQEMNYSRYVDRYLEGVMKNAELLWFEKELDGNKELQREIEMQKKLNSVILDKDSIELQNQLNNIHKRVYGSIIPSFQVSKPARNILITSVCILLAAVFSYVILNKNLNNTSEKLYARYYKPADISMSFRSSGNVLNNDLRSAMSLYDSKKYNAAINLFEKILNEDASRVGLNLYSGISYMEIKQYAEANARFKKVIDQKSNAFVESATWYLGLCYLKTNEKEKARKVFAGIAGAGGYYKNDARHILKSLD